MTFGKTFSNILKRVQVSIRSQPNPSLNWPGVAFIRGLLENVGAEIDPIRLIRRIKNGLEIPGLKEALIKILHDFHLQISLLEGCQTIINGDSSDLAGTRSKGQNSGFFMNCAKTCYSALALLLNASFSENDVSAMYAIPAKVTTRSSFAVLMSSCCPCDLHGQHGWYFAL